MQKAQNKMKIQMVNKNIFHENKGQTLIESVVAFLLITSFLTLVFIGISTGSQIFIWHQKVNKALLCSLNEKIRIECFKDFKTKHALKETKLSHIKLKNFQFLKNKGVPQIEIEIVGYFSEVYKIKKSLNKKTWHI